MRTTVDQEVQDDSWEKINIKFRLNSNRKHLSYQYYINREKKHDNLFAKTKKTL